jgi:hypothetical protein
LAILSLPSIDQDSETVRTARRHLLLTALLLSGAPFAQAQGQSWLDSTIAACAQKYTAERCQDPQFLEQHYHVTTLQVAHKTARRRQQEQRRALSELTLQRVCDHPQKACADGDNLCVMQTQQRCANLEQRAAQCLVQAKSFCAQNPAPGCAQQQTGRCPSADEQKIDELLAKYPLLTAEQKNQMRRVAQQLDDNNRGAIGRLWHWLGF